MIHHLLQEKIPLFSCKHKTRRSDRNGRARKISKLAANIRTNLLESICYIEAAAMVHPSTAETYTSGFCSCVLRQNDLVPSPAPRSFCLHAAGAGENRRAHTDRSVDKLDEAMRTAESGPFQCFYRSDVLNGAAAYRTIAGANAIGLQARDDV